MAFWTVVSLGVGISCGLAIICNLCHGEDVGENNVLGFGFATALFAYLMGWLG